MKSKTVDVYSDGMAYWWRGLALLVGIGVIYGLGIVSQGLAPAPSFHVMLLAAAAIWVVIAFINRPKSFRIEVTDKELRILRLPSESIKLAVPLTEVRYITIRHTGHILGLSVLKGVIRTTKRGTLSFGPIYVEGVDSVASAAVSYLLPRISRDGLLNRKDSKFS